MKSRNARVESLEQEDARDVAVDEGVGRNDIVDRVVVVNLAQGADNVQSRNEEELAHQRGRLAAPAHQQLGSRHGTHKAPDVEHDVGFELGESAGDSGRGELGAEIV